MSDRIIVLKLQSRGMSGTGVSPIEKSQIQSDITALQNRPEINEVGDIPDVDTTGVADGNVLIFDSGTNTWIPASLVQGLEVQRGGTTQGTATTLNFSAAFNVSNVSGVTAIWPVWGGTGSQDAYSRADHTHTNPLPIFQPFAATGYMSGGTRTVVNRSVTLLAGISYVVIARFKPQMRGADPGAAYFTMTTTIDGDSRSSQGGATNGFWCVQGVPNKEEWVHARTIVGTGAAINVSGSIAYHSGSGFNVDAGELEIELKPNR